MAVLNELDVDVVQAGRDAADADRCCQPSFVGRLRGVLGDDRVGDAVHGTRCNRPNHWDRCNSK